MFQGLELQSYKRKWQIFAGFAIVISTQIFMGCGSGLDTKGLANSLMNHGPLKFQISTGQTHTCASANDGSIRCWGLDDNGQLGDGNHGGGLESHNPVRVIGLSGPAKSVSVGYAHSCALLNSGQVQCWGNGPNGELGNSTNSFSPTPVSAIGISGATQLVTGQNHTCALVGASVYCWGNSAFGQVGLSGSSYNTPQIVSGLSSLTIISIVAGMNHTCALTSGGDVYCWGQNLYCQTGAYGCSGSSSTPTLLTGFGGTVQNKIFSGPFANHTCTLDSSGVGHCWGSDGAQQLGDGNTTSLYIPNNLVLLGIKSMSLGNDHSCALMNSGAMKCWGSTSLGQVGNGLGSGSVSIPSDVIGMLSGVFGISAGYGHTCASTEKGQMYCWGNNPNGVLGEGSTFGHNSPVPVIGMFE